MLHGEARQTASILHQTPGWRWRRELCLTVRSQQCQSGPTTKAWRRLLARQRQTRVRHRQSTCEEQCQNWRETLAGEATLDACEASSGARAGSTAGAAWKWVARAGGTARRVRVAPPERDPRGSGQHCFKELGRQRQETCGQHWKHAGCCVRASAGGTARRHRLDECGYVNVCDTNPAALSPSAKHVCVTSHLIHSLHGRREIFLNNKFLLKKYHVNLLKKSPFKLKKRQKT